MLIFCWFITTMMGMSWACDSFQSRNNDQILEVVGNGLHRKIKVKVNIMAKTRFTQCRLMYRFDFPSVMYIDDNAINRTLINHQLVTLRPFDIESPMKDGRPQKAYFIRRKLFLSSFEIKDELEFEAHLRYPSAGPADPNHKLLEPILAIDCVKNQFEDCERMAVHPDPLLKPISKYWIQLTDWQRSSTPLILEGSKYTRQNNESFVFAIFLTLFLFYCISIILEDRDDEFSN